MVYNKADFKKHIETLQIAGFKIKDTVQAFLFIRKQHNRIETITISYRDYAPHGFYIDGVSVDIYFEEVENILALTNEKLNIRSRYGKTGTIQRVFTKLPDINYSVFESEINNESAFNQVAVEVEKIIRLGALPFFEQFRTLQNVIEESEKMVLEEMANFIGQPLPQRRMIIKKLCKDPHFEEYAKMVVDFYEKEKDQDEPIVRQLYHDLKTV
ncbi:MAG: hypothetical protein EHM93_19970 [Bacteroidales bacterium]|nr:MAG: hypothetical protein EHM93_19970 [Bacteroidales bacterium]